MPVHLVFSILGVSLFTLGTLSHSMLGKKETGCLRWKTIQGQNDVCCEQCHPGNRLVQTCGPVPQKLCVPCADGSYTTEPKADTCLWCTQCVGGAQVLKKACTPSTDTVCGCMAGFRCEDDKCRFCVKECGRGQEPTTIRSCKNCSHGTFNDQIHAKCGPWRTSCPNPWDKIVAFGDAESDSKCGPVSSLKSVTIIPTRSGDPQDDSGLVWALTSACIVFIVLIMCFLAFVKKTWKTTPKLPTVSEKTLIEPTPPTDDPRTLVSFHQPQQEQGSSSESLCSQDSETKLLNV